MTPPRAAVLLGYAGLIPFVGLAILAIAGPTEWRTGASTGLLVYGVSILSFMGGCRWGFAAAGLGQGPTLAPLAISVLPALLAWAAFWATPLWGAQITALALVVGFVGLYFSDLAASRNGDAPAWWPALRAPLTVGATGSLAVFAALT
ncbi:MAG: DUF3429 domain-containing protein [Pseudomonadota bacterium]